MTPDQVNDLATIGTTAAFAASLTFCAIYGLGSPGWWRSLLGMSYFASGASLALVLGFVLSRRLWGAYWGYGYAIIGVSVYTLLALACVGQVAIVVYERRRRPLLQIPLRKEKDMTNERNAFGTPESVTVNKTTGQPTLNPAPKVAAAAVTMGILVVAVAMLGAITPDMLTALGPWAPVVFAGIVALGGFLAGYIKRP